MQAQIAMAKSFMESYSVLPRKQQKSVRALLDKFKDNPDSPGINYERIQVARDDKARSLRIDQAYRAIVVHPPKGDIHLCVWVGKHDDAYKWVADKVFEVNPISGVMQYYNVEPVAPPPEELCSADEQNIELTDVSSDDGLFCDHPDEDLLMAGVPDPLLASVRAITDDQDLDDLAPHLPSDASEMLYALAMGYSLDDAIAELSRSEPAVDQIDTSDFEAALARPTSGAEFHLVSDETELGEMLNAPLDKWRVFLHPTQQKLVQMKSNGPIRVLGGAGTGKTVVLMHRARYLLENVFSAPSDRILVTTFTRNLALALAANLEELCPGVCGRMDIVHLHKWAADFLGTRGITFRIARNTQRSKMMTGAISRANLGSGPLPPAFFREEWDRVIQQQDISSCKEYLRASRTGRGTPLSRQQRAEIWPVFEEYRQSLDSEGLREWSELAHLARKEVLREGVGANYRAVLADEVQDFSQSELRLLRAITPDGPDPMMLVGDGHQRIYGQPAVLSHCGIDIRGRGRRLKLNYRTTEQIGRRARSVLGDMRYDDLDGGTDSLSGYASLRSGPDPIIETFGSLGDETSFVCGTVSGWIADGVDPDTICIAARTNRELSEIYGPAIGQSGIEHVNIRLDPDSDFEPAGVRLTTMHRMKGLEFSRVLLAGVNSHTMPLVTGDFEDEARHEEHENQERCLLYVACSRARDSLVISGHGKPSPFLSG